MQEYPDLVILRILCIAVHIFWQSNGDMLTSRRYWDEDEPGRFGPLGPLEFRWWPRPLLSGSGTALLSNPYPSHTPWQGTLRFRTGHFRR